MSRTSFLVALTFVVAGCTVPTGAPDPEPTATTEKALGAVVREKSWSSGKTSDLSSWKTLDCYTTYGSSYFLHAFEAFREPATNLDNFIARLEGQCGTVTGASTSDVTIFTSDHRTPGGRVDSFQDWLNYNSETGFWNTPPEGVDILVNHKEYVKNVRFAYHSWSNYAGTYGYALDYSGSRVNLMCDEGWVVTAVKLRYDTSKGKIRDFKIECRER